MKSKLVKIASGLGAALIVGVLAFWACSRPEKVEWPQFKPATDAAPRLAVHVQPDFGYRIGDLVNVTIFIRQQPGTKVDLSSTAIEGDFEFYGEPQYDEEVLPDGAKLIRIKQSLQSFSSTPSITSRISMTWTEDGKKEAHEIPKTEITVFTSKTYDGRPDNLQNGPLAFVTPSLLTRCIVLAVLSLTGIVVATIFIRRYISGLPVHKPVVALSPRMKARQRFDAVWKKIEGGDLSEENFREIEAILRDFFKVQTVLREYIPIAVGEGHPHIQQITAVFDLCEMAIYQQVVLNAQQLRQLKDSFDDVILRR